MRSELGRKTLPSVVIVQQEQEEEMEMEEQEMEEQEEQILQGEVTLCPCVLLVSFCRCVLCQPGKEAGVLDPAVSLCLSCVIIY